MTVDITQKVNTRGFYICKKESCLKKLRNSKRTIKFMKGYDLQKVCKSIEKVIRVKPDSLLKILSVALKAGQVSVGRYKVEKALKKRKAKLILLSESLSDRTKKDIIFMAEKYNIKIMIINMTMEDLAKTIGKRSGIFSINNEGFVKSISSKEQR